MSKAQEVTKLMNEVSGKALPSDVSQIKVNTSVMFKKGEHEGLVGFVANVHADKKNLDVFLGKKLVTEVKPDDLLQVQDTTQRVGSPTRPEAK